MLIKLIGLFAMKAHESSNY